MLFPMKTLPLLLAVALVAATLPTPASADRVEGRGLELTAQAGLVSVDWKDADLGDDLRLLARVGNVNLVLDQAVAGKTLTLALHDVGWEQALAVACSTNGFGAEMDGNVLRVAPLGKLTAERQQLAQLRQAEADSAPLTTVAFPLAWADATQAEAIVRKSLSPRGSTTVDRRTNTLIVTDVFGSPALGEAFQPALELPTQGPPIATHDVTVQLLGALAGDIVAIRAVEAPGADARALASTLSLPVGRRVELPGVPGLKVGLERDGSRLVLVARAGRAGAQAPASGRQAFALSTDSGTEAILVAEAR